MTQKEYRWWKNGEPLAFLQANVHFDGPDCLTWPFSKNCYGYAQLRHEAKVARAHRVMCTLAHGEPPSSEHYAAHECGNGHLACVHPKHLKWKTHAENSEDAVRHGRLRTDKGKSRRKLTHEQVLTILNPPPGKTLRELSEEFGVTYLHASKIRRGVYWRGGMPHKPGNNGIDEEVVFRGQSITS